MRHKIQKGSKRTIMSDKELKQQIFIASYEESFSVSEAALAAGVHRSTIYRWLKNVEDNSRFIEEYYIIKLVKKDLFEAQLFERVMAGETRAIIYACKTYLKDRGYGEG